MWNGEDDRRVLLVYDMGQQHSDVRGSYRRRRAVIAGFSLRA